MSYDLPIVRTIHWLDASQAPITKEEVDDLVAADPELEWSTADYLDMKVDSKDATRFYGIEWNGQTCFYWYQDQIICSNPNETQVMKLARIAHLLNAYAVGDDGERYEVHTNLFGKEKLVIVNL